MKEILEGLLRHDLLIPTFTIFVPLLFLLRKNIRKHAMWYYIGFTVFAAAVITFGFYVILADQKYPDSLIFIYLYNLFKRGALGFVLFVVVMFQGVIRPWNRATKELYAIRGEISIFACIASFAHICIYSLGWLASTKPSSQDPLYDVLFWSSITLLAVGIPLFITSFKKIRYSMRSVNWHKLHKISYFFYFLLYANVAVVFLRRFFRGKIFDPDRFAELITSGISLTIVCSLFLVYTFLRFRVSLNKAARNKLRKLRAKAHENRDPLEAA